MIWNDRGQFIFVALLGVLLWVINLSQAHILGPISAALPAVIAGFTTPFILTISWLITRKKFSITTTYVAFSCMATFNLVMGPPGIHKIFLALLAGLSFDLALMGLKRLLGQRIALYAAFTFYTIVSMATYVGAFVVLDLPGKEKLLNTVFVFAAVFYIEGLISVTIASTFYNRWLKTIPIVQEWASHDLISRKKHNLEKQTD